MIFFFIIKIIPNFLKCDVIVGDNFGVLFQVQNDMTQIVLARGRLKMPMKENKGFVCFEMLKEG
jgi:hypothetical protein